MSALATTFAQGTGRTLLVPYMTVGFPQADSTVALMDALEDAGADIIELGVPFSDPAADGPVIQRANDQALANRASLTSALAAAASYRDGGGKLPVVLMGYANPFLRFGPARLARECNQAGVSGVLAVDWPAGDPDELGAATGEEGVDRISLIAPTTPEERIASIAAKSSGYLYYVSIKGVTGTGKASHSEALAAAAKIRKQTGLPIAIGFGISTPQDCAALAAGFDAVVVGSCLVAAAAAAGSTSAAASAIGKIVSEMKAALQ
ncbi:MAG: tryptophan synthase subunit alpha [Betaproteobacteria bacterium]|nr:tryptophan synthase subunit alpha [Betaproteobacteria bacterium]